ncbi:MAG: YvcK family protein [Bryobacteraceae bacterium]|nr:YvcK family protein [Bryobacteraceae bacterium]
MPKIARDLFFSPLAGPRIVAIGGGTGLSTLLKGLKKFARFSRPTVGAGLSPLVDLTAVVTVTDDGGSSGRLRRELDMLPPGDIRNCMVAMSEDEALLSKLFQYRFQAGRGLKGHSFGNLFLTALTHLTGDFAQAVKLSSEVLSIGGHIYPSTGANVGLRAHCEDGSVIAGETNISRCRSPIRSIELEPRNVKPLKETLEAIRQADLVTLGPGSLFTSVIPNLLVDGVVKALRRSPAVKVYFCNLMWQPGETSRFKASDHVKAIHDHAGDKIIEYVVINTAPIAKPQRKRYARELAMPVENDIEQLEEMGLRVVTANLLGESHMVRHDPDASAAVALELAVEGRRRKAKAASGSRMGS